MTSLTGNSFGMRQFQTNANNTPPQDGLLAQIRELTPDQALNTYTKNSYGLEGLYHTVGRLIQVGEDVPEQQPQLAIKIQQLEQQAGRLAQVQQLIVQSHPEAFSQPQVWQS